MPLIEDRVRRVLTDEKLSSIRALLEKDHAIECIFLLYMNKGNWKEAKKFMESINRPIRDGTFRARMIEFVNVKLAEVVAIDPLKSHFRITVYGRMVANLLVEFFEKLMVFS